MKSNQEKKEGRINVMKTEKVKSKKNKPFVSSIAATSGITLIALVVTIVVLIILATITINIVIDNGILTKTQEASEEYNKQAASERINLKITNIQITSYAENKQLPTLQYLADKLCEDNDIEYVTLESQATASLDKIVVGENTSVFTKLKEYPYEFEIDSSLRLASVDGIKIATTDNQDYQQLKDEIALLKEQYQEQQTKIQSLEASLVTEDISSSIHLNTDYVTERLTVKLTKNGNTVHFMAYLNIVADIPNGATVVTIDSQYVPKYSYVGMLNVNNGDITSYTDVHLDGRITIAKKIGISDMSIPTMQIDLVWQI